MAPPDTHKKYQTTTRCLNVAFRSNSNAPLWPSQIVNCTFEMKSMQLCPSVQPPVLVCALLQEARITHAGSGTDASLYKQQAGKYLDTVLNDENDR